MMAAPSRGFMPNGSSGEILSIAKQNKDISKAKYN